VPEQRLCLFETRGGARVYDFLQVLVIVWVLVEIPLCVWLFRAKPERVALLRYSRRTRYLSQLPFGDKWKQAVTTEDLPVLAEYQRRVRIWYLSLIIPFVVFFAYLSVDVFFLH
jgi:hypothetical protein